MRPSRATLLPGVPLVLCLPLVAIRRCWGLSASDVWSGSVWEQAQKARDKHASNSDRLMQHLWQHPERADQFVDCDILADSETDKHFKFLNLYDADDAREDLLNALPADGYVRGLWPVKDGKSTVPYTIASGVGSTLSSVFERAARRWEAAASVKFVKSSQKPHLEVTLDGGCFATLGYHASEPRKLSLHPGRCTEPVVVHLLGHVLGLPHPTSTVGRADEQYLMPHHAAPRALGVLSTRAGAAFDPLDIMAVDPWFCAVGNRSTWRPLSPILYRWAAVTGSWTLAGHPNPERRSASTGLLQKEIQQRAGQHACSNRCSDPCREFVTPLCICVRPFEMADPAYEKLATDEGLWKFDMGKKLPGFSKSKELNIKLLNAPKIRAFFHSTNVDELGFADEDGAKCWQCSLFVFVVHTNGVFDSQRNRLVALGSRCTLFSLELNGVLEEAWYRLCLHHLLHTTTAAGDVQLAFRGPATVLIRYFSAQDVFAEFHKQFTEKVTLSWSEQKTVGCRCADGPAREIQNSVVKQ